MEEKKCLCCEKVLENKRKKFCSDRCRKWYNELKKDKEYHLAPAKKRNKNFFSMVTGYGWAKSKGTGRRSGGSTKGAMSASVNCTIEEWAEVNYDNLKRHFTCISHYSPSGIKLGNGDYVPKESIYLFLGVDIDF